MFLITSVFGFLQPFVPLYMEASGLKRAQIGLVMGMGSGLALLVQPLLGRLSDRLDLRRPLMALAAAAAGLAYLAYRSANGLLAFILLTALGSNALLYLNAAGGVLIGRLVGSGGRGGATYAGYRVWGSVGYILVALSTGRLLRPGTHSGAALGRDALRPVFTYGPWLFFLIVVAALLVPDRRKSDDSGAQATPNAEIDAALSANRLLPARLQIFLVAFFFYQVALYGSTAYLSLFLKSLGATPLWITGVFAAGVVCEVLVMTRVGRFADRYGRRPALAVAFLLMPIRLLLYIPARGPLWVLFVQTMHGLNFGIMGAIAIAFVNDLANEHNRGAAQARLAAAGGLATAIGPILCGWLADRVGLGGMFAAMSVMGFIGAFIFLTRVHESLPDPVALPTNLPAFLHPVLRLLAGPPD